MKKIINFLILILVLSLTNCDYKPIYSEKNSNFRVEIDSITGNEKVNSILNKKFESLDANNSLLYNIKIISNLQKTVISNDSKGDPELFEMLITTNIEVYKKEKNVLNTTIKKDVSYRNKSDKFDLEKYEEIVIKNLSENIFQEIIMSLSNINL